MIRKNLGLILIWVFPCWFLVTGCNTKATRPMESEILAETILAKTVAAYTHTPLPTDTPAEAPEPSLTPSKTLAPSATQTPFSTPTNTPTPIPLLFVLVLSEGLYLRDGPGSEYFIAGDAVRDDEMLVNGQAYACTWLQVEKEDGTQGWVPADKVNFEYPCEWIQPLDIPPTPHIPSATPTNPGGTKFAVFNNTGQTVTLTFSGNYNYTFTVPAGRSQVSVIAGEYSIGISCGGSTSYVYGYVSSGWVLRIDSCP